MNINDYIKSKRIPSKRVFAEILGISASALNNRMHEYGYDVIEHKGKVLRMVNPDQDKYLEHSVSERDIKIAVDRYWENK